MSHKVNPVNRIPLIGGFAPFLVPLLRMYFIKTPWYLKSVYPSLVWDMPKQNTLYLTFDDGPVPGVTDKILQILASYEARATFFCIGDNVQKHPDLFHSVSTAGHAIGNHTFHHVNGWKTNTAEYVQEADDCDALTGSMLFRPPYGRISYQQIQELKKKYAIIMWDVLSGDFDLQLTPDQCAHNVTANASDGSIIVFHDSEKAKERVLNALPKVLHYFKNKGYAFSALPLQHEALPKGLHLD